MALKPHPRDLTRACHKCKTEYLQPGECPTCNHKTYFVKPDGECEHSVVYSADGWERQESWRRYNFLYCPSCGLQLDPMVAEAPRKTRELKGVCPTCGDHCHETRVDIPKEYIADQGDARRYCISCGAKFPKTHRHSRRPPEYLLPNMVKTTP